MPFLVTNNSATMSLFDLGNVVINYPTIDRDLELEFSEDILKRSQSLYQAIYDGSITAKNGYGYNITYDKIKTYETYEINPISPIQFNPLTGQISMNVATATQSGYLSYLDYQVLNTDTGNIRYVSISGSNSTAVLGKISNPYLTISGAMIDANPGETILVFPGTYDDHSIDIGGKDNVNVMLLPGVTIQPTYNSGNVTIFKDISGVVTGFKIFGEGKLINTGNGGEDSCAVQLANASTIDIVEASEISTVSIYNNARISKIKNALINKEITCYIGASLTFEKCSIEDIYLGWAFNYVTGDFIFRDCTFKKTYVDENDGSVARESCFAILPAVFFTSIRRFSFEGCNFINTLTSSTYSTPDCGLSAIKIVTGDYQTGSFVSIIDCKFDMGSTASPILVQDTDPGVFSGTGTENTNLKYYLLNNICNTTSITIIDTLGITTSVTNEFSSPGFNEAAGFKIL